MKARIVLVLWVTLAIAIAITQGRGSSFGSSAATPTPSTGVVRTVLVGATPVNEPDQSLQLVRYDIQPGTTLPAHIHPGTQIAWISEGDLSYYVVTGKARIERAGQNGTHGPIEYIEAGNHTVLHAGDSVIETQDMIHYGANLGDLPVVILAATLLEADEPAAIVQATPVP